MTTISVPGFSISYANSSAGEPGDLMKADFVVPSKNATFSYSLVGTSNGLPEADIKENAYQIRLNDTIVEDLEKEYGEVETGIARITWSGGVTTVLQLTFSQFDDLDIVFEIDGAALPTFNNSADWQKFNNSITDVAVAQGRFAPGQDIKWTDFNGSTFTQDDEFYGTPRNDRFFGKQGDDYFNSSAGNDLFNGGKGNFDQASYRGDPAGVHASLAKGKATDGWGSTDTLKSIEVLRGSMFDDTLIGKNGSNHIRGLEGDDVLNGLKGRDVVRYDIDARYGGDAGATVNLKKGFAIDGFGDRDTLKNFTDAYGTDSKDLIIGDKAKNELQGNGGNDVIRGLGGKDILLGGTGRDKLDGGKGNDMLTGEGGADRFMFKGKKFGDDTVTDFQTGGRKEKIDLSKVATIKSFKDLKNNHLSEENGNAVIDDDRGNSVTLLEIAMNDLSANDFIF